ncbi:hypothetical protein D3C77_613540 [compost metagenome]
MFARQVEGRDQGTTLFAAHVRIDFGKQRPALIEQLAERFEHQGVLAVEVRIEASHGQPRRTHDFIDAGLGRAVLDQCTAGSFEYPFAGFCLFVVHDLPPNIMVRILFS